MQLKTITRGFVLDPAKEKRDVINPKHILIKLGLKQGMCLADFGAGAGHFALPAAKIVGDRGKVYAIDILKSELADIRSKASMSGLYNMDLVWADLEVPGSSKIKDGSCDFVVMANILYQSKKDDEVLKEASRVVKKEGMVVVIEWIKGNVPIGPPVESRISKEELIEIAKSAGLEVSGDFDAGSYHYVVTFKKT